ncbi:MAG TPA: hypothetical protein VFM31_03050 [Nitrososphaeraceae archaeon]|nr:hypothetical protein [Nitrososphaeraceae archaeon]
MGNENILTNQEKWNLVKKLLMEGKSFREIEKIAHVSPNFITKVKKVDFGQDSVYEENENTKKNKKLSKRTQAIDLFYQGKTPKKVLLELDMDVNEVTKAQSDYFQLLDLDHLSEIFQNNSNNLIKEFYSLFKIFKELGLDTIEKVKEIKELVKVYPHLQLEISQLNKEIRILNKKKQFDEKVLNDIEYKISLANASQKEIENQIYNKKIILENLEILEKRKVHLFIMIML